MRNSEVNKNEKPISQNSSHKTQFGIFVLFFNFVMGIKVMETIVKSKKSIASSKSELVNRLSLIDEIIRVGYSYAGKYVLDDVEAFYLDIKGKDYEVIKKDLIAQLDQANRAR